VRVEDGRIALVGLIQDRCRAVRETYVAISKQIVSMADRITDAVTGSTVEVSTLLSSQPAFRYWKGAVDERRRDSLRSVAVQYSILVMLALLPLQKVGAPSPARFVAGSVGAHRDRGATSSRDSASVSKSGSCTRASARPSAVSRTTSPLWGVPSLPWATV